MGNNPFNLSREDLGTEVQKTVVEKTFIYLYGTIDNINYWFVYCEEHTPYITNFMKL